jgi:hypothetical protein
MRRLAIACTVVAAFAVVWLAVYPVLVYRVRITVNVDTPEGLRSGSSVSEIHARRYPAWMELSSGPYGQSMSIRGEAVFVDIGPDQQGKHRNLIALMCLGPRGDDVDFYRLPAMAFEPAWKERMDAFGPFGSEKKQRGKTYPDIQIELTRLTPGTSASLSGKLVPTLASFADLNDPLSVRLVDPEKLGSFFGNGVRLRNVSIELVSGGRWPLTLLDFSSESVTETIEKKLPLLAKLRSLDSQFQIRTAGELFRARTGYFRQGF